jgi:D-3-phosphoglycerate dehydrogenase
MAHARILLLESVHAGAREELSANGAEVTEVGRGLGEDELIRTLTELPGEGPLFVGIRSKTHVTARVMTEVPDLAGVGAFCIGTDQIDLAEARARGVAVFNAPFSSTRSVAELVIGEIIMLARQTFGRSMAAHRGEWAKSATGAHEVRNKTLGIIGYGHIGSQASILAEAMGMRVLYHDISGKLPLGNATAAGDLAQLLAASDFVSLHVPDTDLTRGMMGEEALRAMKPGSCLINLSRGQVVDIPALVSALDDKHLAGAALDVFPTEPASKDEPFDSPLRGRDNVILTPHVGGSTQEAQANIGREVAGAVVGFLNSGRTSGSVSLPVLDAPLRPGCSRIVNVHRNEPGALSAVNRVVAESETNIVGQQLATLEDVGLLFVDVPLAADDPRARSLSQAIDALDPSVRTRLI